MPSVVAFLRVALTGRVLGEGERRDEGVGILEAPRGTLFHHYRIDEQDIVTMCNLIVSTTSNNEPMNRAVESVARQYLDGKEITEGLLNHVEVAIRAYDPCLSCATHALGQMPLVVDLLDASGALLDSRKRGSDHVCPSFAESDTHTSDRSSMASSFDPRPRYCW